MENSTKRSERIYWIDSLRFIAMFLVYIGHLGPNAGRIYGFVYLFHVPLFFFISGMFYNNKGSLSENIRSGFKKLIIPYFLYSALSLIVYILFLQKDVSQVYPLLVQLIGAKRNFIEYAPQLWFLPCLFIVMVVFKGLHSFSDNKLIIFIICTLTMIASVYLPENPVSFSPLLPYGLDSAAYYIFWYCLGSLSKSKVIAFFDDDNLATKTVFTISLFFAAFCFFGLMHPYENAVTNLVGGRAYSILWIIPTLILFVACVPVAKVLAPLKPVRYLGSNTLFLCGNEQIAKTTFIAMIGISGHALNIGDEYYSFIYTCMLMIMIYIIKTNAIRLKA
ncbi:acyltransferase family protein [Enterobacter asburiae]|uniref:acyltransferase family protein n=1 Tax=Enterobacter asburiae TaxID=61645 RepID=UPI00192C2C68|nr:acyltransferase family protein [Enterobacter asburiae]MBL5924944.1 acyltransferase family protein [Enterobacter asburiae]MBL5955731.1 acyltransferase family protein [Enterobacter asburiae]